MFNPEMESMPLDKLRKMQGERLKILVKYVFDKIPFYKSKFNELGIGPGDINSMEDINKLPFTEKEDLRVNYPFRMFAVPNDEIVRIHCSSGTTGKPIVVGYTQKDIETFAEVNARSLYSAGARKGMKLHNAYGYGLFTGGLGLHYGGEKLGMSVIPVSGGMTDRQIMLLEDFKSEVICCTPSYGQALGEEIQNRELNDKINLKYAVLGAEPWTEGIRTDVESRLNVIATNIFGLSEIIGPGVSQEDFEEKGSGSTIWEDHFYPEIIHPESEEILPYGQDGILVITTLTKEAMPLIRYKTNDICSLHYDSDSKRTHIKMSHIKGRVDNMLIIRGVNLYPTQIEEILTTFSELSLHYHMAITRSGNLDEVEVQLELSDNEYQNLGVSNIKELGVDYLEDIEARVKKKIKGIIGLSINIDILEKGTVPRSEGGKLNRVTDKRTI